MRTVYVVMGSTGEYSNRREWPVRGYFTEAEAQAEVLRLDEIARVVRLEIETRRDAGDWNTDGLVAAARQADPAFDHDYTGTSYFIYDVPLVEQ